MTTAMGAAENAGETDMTTTTAERSPMQATSLDDLLSRVQALPTDDDLDLTRLPTFGGEEPDSTHGVFSWDAGRLLVQDRTGWRIVARSERQ